MSTSTSIYAAYGMDVSEFADMDELSDDTAFDRLRRSLGLKVDDLELRMYGNLCSGEVGYLLIDPKTVQETELTEPRYLDCSYHRGKITALTLVCDKLGIQLQAGWIVYGVRG